MFEICFENMIHEKSLSYEDENMILNVWGDFFEGPTLPFDSKKIKKKGYAFLNFDGGYVAFYQDKKHKKQVIFCSHRRNFDTYYVRQENKIIFSDSFYYLVSKLESGTWNFDSLSDYFEGAWNHICKYDRTPIKEINKLDNWNYIEIKQNTKEIIQKSWKKLDSKILYTEKNLDDFKVAFFKILDTYLSAIHKKNAKVGISLSGGVDTNTIAAEWSKLYPNEQTTFFTSKIDDVNDESKIASFMQDVISSKINFIPIKLEETDIVNELYSHMQNFIPPRFMSLLSEKYLYTQLMDNGISMPYITGIGADGLFGFFDGEYSWFMKKLIKERQYNKAEDVYEAIQVSFSQTNKTISQIHEEFKNIVKKYRQENSILVKIVNLVKNIIKIVIHYEPKCLTHTDNNLLLFSLPTATSKNIKNYKDAVNYASYDGAVVDQSLLCNKIGLRLFHPYEGYKFMELAAHCDPYIFSNRINKSCMRYAVSGLLPKQILSNKAKIGQPGVSEEKVFSANKQRIIAFLDSKQSNLVNVDELKLQFQNNIFGEREFLCLALVVFEDILACKYKLRLRVPSQCSNRKLQMMCEKVSL